MIHQAAFDVAGDFWTYAAFDVAAGSGADAIAAMRVLGIAGLSVTMPHKRDVADAVDGAENSRLAAWADQSAAVIVNIQRQPGANVIEVVDRIKRLLPQLNASLPAAVDVDHRRAVAGAVGGAGAIALGWSLGGEGLARWPLPIRRTRTALRAASSRCPACRLA